MTFDPSKILTRPIRIRSLILTGSMVGYFCFSLLIFFGWVDPSLDGRTDQHIAADSGTYIQYAEALRSGVADPFLIASLSSFPNTLLLPVLLALALKSTFAMVVTNYAMFFISICLLKKCFSFSASTFLVLLLFNATTTISLLSVNKEIVDFLAISLFLFARRKHHNALLVLALLLAILNRYEVCVVMLVFLMVRTKLNPLHQRRVGTLFALIVALSVVLPVVASRSLNDRFADETEGGHTVVWLDMLEIHYLYGIAVIPKIVESLFGEFVNLYSKRVEYLSFSDIANTYIMLFNNLATAIVLLVLAVKRKFTLGSDIVYLALLGWVIMSIALVIQPRYVYFIYVLLCLQAAQTEADTSTGRLSLEKPEKPNGNAPILAHKEAAFG